MRADQAAHALEQLDQLVGLANATADDDARVVLARQVGDDLSIAVASGLTRQSSSSVARSAAQLEATIRLMRTQGEHGLGELGRER